MRSSLASLALAATIIGAGMVQAQAPSSGRNDTEISEECKAAGNGPVLTQKCFKHEVKDWTADNLNRMCSRSDDDSMCSADVLKSALDELESKCKAELQNNREVQAAYQMVYLYDLEVKARYCLKSSAGDYCILQPESANGEKSCSDCRRAMWQEVMQWQPQRKSVISSDELDSVKKDGEEEIKRCNFTLQPAKDAESDESSGVPLQATLPGAAVAVVLGLLCFVA